MMATECSTPVRASKNASFAGLHPIEHPGLNIRGNCKVVVIIDSTHNPFDESYRVSCWRENLTSSFEGEGLEMGLGSTSVPRSSLPDKSCFTAALRQAPPRNRARGPSTRLYVHPCT
jgi:hypothetical protein